MSNFSIIPTAVGGTGSNKTGIPKEQTIKQKQQEYDASIKLQDQQREQAMAQMLTGVNNLASEFIASDAARDIGSAGFEHLYKKFTAEVLASPDLDPEMRDIVAMELKQVGIAETKRRNKALKEASSWGDGFFATRMAKDVFASAVSRVVDIGHMPANALMDEGSLLGSHVAVKDAHEYIGQVDVIPDWQAPGGRVKQGYDDRHYGRLLADGRQRDGVDELLKQFSIDDPKLVRSKMTDLERELLRTADTAEYIDLMAGVVEREHRTWQTAQKLRKNRADTATEIRKRMGSVYLEDNEKSMGYLATQDDTSFWDKVTLENTSTVVGNLVPDMAAVLISGGGTAAVGAPVWASRLASVGTTASMTWNDMKTDLKQQIMMLTDEQVLQEGRFEEFKYEARQDNPEASDAEVASIIRHAIMLEAEDDSVVARVIAAGTSFLGNEHLAFNAVFKKARQGAAAKAVSSDIKERGLLAKIGGTFAKPFKRDTVIGAGIRTIGGNTAIEAVQSGAQSWITHNATANAANLPTDWNAIWHEVHMGMIGGLLMGSAATPGVYKHNVIEARTDAAEATIKAMKDAAEQAETPEAKEAAAKARAVAIAESEPMSLADLEAIDTADMDPLDRALIRVKIHAKRSVGDEADLAQLESDISTTRDALQLEIDKMHMLQDQYERELGKSVGYDVSGKASPRVQAHEAMYNHQRKRVDAMMQRYDALNELYEGGTAATLGADVNFKSMDGFIGTVSKVELSENPTNLERADAVQVGLTNLRSDLDASRAELESVRNQKRALDKTADAAAYSRLEAKERGLRNRVNSLEYSIREGENHLASLGEDTANAAKDVGEVVDSISEDGKTKKGTADSIVEGTNLVEAGAQRRARRDELKELIKELDREIDDINRSTTPEAEDAMADVVAQLEESRKEHQSELDAIEAEIEQDKKIGAYTVEYNMDAGWQDTHQHIFGDQDGEPGTEHTADAGTDGTRGDGVRNDATDGDAGRGGQEGGPAGRTDSQEGGAADVKRGEQQTKARPDDGDSQENRSDTSGRDGETGARPTPAGIRDSDADSAGGPEAGSSNIYAVPTVEGSDVMRAPHQEELTEGLDESVQLSEATDDPVVSNTHTTEANKKARALQPEGFEVFDGDGNLLVTRSNVQVDSLRKWAASLPEKSQFRAVLESAIESNDSDVIDSVYWAVAPVRTDVPPMGVVFPPNGIAVLEAALGRLDPATLEYLGEVIAENPELIKHGITAPDVLVANLFVAAGKGEIKGPLATILANSPMGRAVDSVFTAKAAPLEEADARALVENMPPEAKTFLGTYMILTGETSYANALGLLENTLARERVGAQVPAHQRAPIGGRAIAMQLRVLRMPSESKDVTSMLDSLPKEVADLVREMVDVTRDPEMFKSADDFIARFYFMQQAVARNPELAGRAMAATPLTREAQALLLSYLPAKIHGQEYAAVRQSMASSMSPEQIAAINKSIIRAREDLGWSKGVDVHDMIFDAEDYLVHMAAGRTAAGHKVSGTTEASRAEFGGEAFMSPDETASRIDSLALQFERTGDMELARKLRELGNRLKTTDAPKERVSTYEVPTLEVTDRGEDPFSYVRNDDDVSMDTADYEHEKAIKEREESEVVEDAQTLIDQHNQLMNDLLAFYQRAAESDDPRDALNMVESLVKQINWFREAYRRKVVRAALDATIDYYNGVAPPPSAAHKQAVEKLRNLDRFDAFTIIFDPEGGQMITEFLATVKNIEIADTNSIKAKEAKEAQEAENRKIGAKKAAETRAKNRAKRDAERAAEAERVANLEIENETLQAEIDRRDAADKKAKVEAAKKSKEDQKTIKALEKDKAAAERKLAATEKKLATAKDKATKAAADLKSANQRAKKAEAEVLKLSDEVEVLKHFEAEVAELTKQIEELEAQIAKMPETITESVTETDPATGKQTTIGRRVPNREREKVVAKRDAVAERRGEAEEVLTQARLVQELASIDESTPAADGGMGMFDDLSAIQKSVREGDLGADIGSPSPVTKTQTLIDERAERREAARKKVEDKDEAAKKKAEADFEAAEKRRAEEEKRKADEEKKQAEKEAAEAEEARKKAEAEAEAKRAEEEKAALEAEEARKKAEEEAEAEAKQKAEEAARKKEEEANKAEEERRKAEEEEKAAAERKAEADRKAAEAESTKGSIDAAERIETKKAKEKPKQKKESDEELTPQDEFEQALIDAGYEPKQAKEEAERAFSHEAETGEGGMFEGWTFSTSAPGTPPATRSVFGGQSPAGRYGLDDRAPLYGFTPKKDSPIAEAVSENTGELHDVLNDLSIMLDAPFIGDHNLDGRAVDEDGNRGSATETRPRDEGSNHPLRTSDPEWYGVSSDSNKFSARNRFLDAVSGGLLRFPDATYAEFLRGMAHGDIDAIQIMRDFLTANRKGGLAKMLRAGTPDAAVLMSSLHSLRNRERLGIDLPEGWKLTDDARRLVDAMEIWSLPRRTSTDNPYVALLEGLPKKSRDLLMEVTRAERKRLGINVLADFVAAYVETLQYALIGRATTTRGPAITVTDPVVVSALTQAITSRYGSPIHRAAGVYVRTLEPAQLQSIEAISSNLPDTWFIGSAQDGLFVLMQGLGTGEHNGVRFEVSDNMPKGKDATVIEEKTTTAGKKSTTAHDMSRLKKAIDTGSNPEGFVVRISRGLMNLVQRASKLAMGLFLGVSLMLSQGVMDQAHAQGVAHVGEPTAHVELSHEANVVNKFALDGDAKGEPYIIADKATGTIHFMSAKGEVIATDNAIYGSEIGDGMTGRQTPAGSFYLSRKNAPKNYGGDIMSFGQDDTGAIYAIHRVIDPAVRNPKLKSSDPADRRVSAGCINLAPGTYDRMFGKGNYKGRLYIVPEKESVDRVFPKTRMVEEYPAVTDFSDLADPGWPAGEARFLEKNPDYAPSETVYNMLPATGDLDAGMGPGGIALGFGAAGFLGLGVLRRNTQRQKDAPSVKGSQAGAPVVSAENTPTAFTSTTSAQAETSMADVSLSHDNPLAAPVESDQARINAIINDEQPSNTQSITQRLKGWWSNFRVKARTALVAEDTPLNLAINTALGVANIHEDHPYFMAYRKGQNLRGTLEVMLRKDVEIPLKDTLGILARSVDWDETKFALTVGQYMTALHAAEEGNAAIRSDLGIEIKRLERQREALITLLRGRPNFNEAYHGKVIKAIASSEDAPSFSEKAASEALNGADSKMTTDDIAKLVGSLNKTLGQRRRVAEKFDHIERAQAKGEEVPPEMYNGVGFTAGLTTADARKIMADLEAKVPKDVLEQAVNAFVEANQKIDAFRLERGSQDPNEFIAMKEHYKFKYYVPAFKDVDSGKADIFESDVVLGAEAEHVRKGMRRGSPQAMFAFEGTLQRMRKAVNGAAFVDFRTLLPEISAQSMARQGAEVRLREVPADQQVPRDVSGYMVGMDGKKYYWDNPPGLQGADHVNKAMRDLHRLSYDPNTGMGKARTALTKTTRAFAMAVTMYNPLFAPKNAINDMIERHFHIMSRDFKDDNGNRIQNKDIQRAYLKYATAGMVQGTTMIKSKSWDKLQWATGRLKDLGGYMDFEEGLAANLQQSITDFETRFPKTLTSKTRKLMSDANGLVAKWNRRYNEMAPAATFLALIENGMSEQDAAHATREMMNFNTRGKLGRTWYGQSVAFMNAAFQSGYNAAKDLSTKTGRRHAVVKFALWSLQYQVLKAIAEGFRDVEDEVEDNPLDQMKITELVRGLPLFLSEDGQFAKIPTGFGISRIILALSIASDRLANGRMTMPEAMEELVTVASAEMTPYDIGDYNELSLVHQVAHAITPTIGQPFVQWLTGKNTFSRDISPEGSRWKPAHKTSFGNTEDFYISLADDAYKWTGVDAHPETFKFFTQQFAVGPLRGITEYITRESSYRSNKEWVTDSANLGILLRSMGASGLVGQHHGLDRAYWKQEDKIDDMLRKAGIDLTDPDQSGNPEQKRKRREAKMRLAGFDPAAISLVEMSRANENEMKKISKELRIVRNGHLDGTLSRDMAEAKARPLVEQRTELMRQAIERGQLLWELL